MFHSSGFFSGILCPFYEHGLCHRPYCHYRHSRRERPPPRKRPQLKTKYTRYPADSPATDCTGTDAASESKLGGESNDVTGLSGEAVKDDGEENSAAMIFNFYGAQESVNNNEGAVEGDDKHHECGMEIGTNSITNDQPGAVVELPSYAPDVCVETVVVFSETEVVLEDCSEKEVKKPQVVEVDAVTIEIAREESVAMEMEPHPPTTECRQQCDDITEEDIFGSSDEDAEPTDVSVVRE